MVFRPPPTDLASLGNAPEALPSEETRYCQVRQSLLKQAFEGRLVAQNPADEPARRCWRGCGHGRPAGAMVKLTGRPIRPSRWMLDWSALNRWMTWGEDVNKRQA